MRQNARTHPDRIHNRPVGLHPLIGSAARWMLAGVAIQRVKPRIAFTKLIQEPSDRLVRFAMAVIMVATLVPVVTAQLLPLLNLGNWVVRLEVLICLPFIVLSFFVLLRKSPLMWVGWIAFTVVAYTVGSSERQRTLATTAGVALGNVIFSFVIGAILCLIVSCFLPKSHVRIAGCFFIGTLLGVMLQHLGAHA